VNVRPKRLRRSAGREAVARSSVAQSPGGHTNPPSSHGAGTAQMQALKDTSSTMNGEHVPPSPHGPVNGESLGVVENPRGHR
jgi:hypothetical protein